MKRRSALLFAALTLVAFGSAAAAQDATDCLAFPSALDKVTAMQVIGSGPARFFEAWVDGCERSAEHCQKRSYVLPGDRVLAEGAGAGFSCAWYLDGKGRESWGLLSAARLARATLDEPAFGDLAAWAGHWRKADLTELRAQGKEALVPTADIAIVVDGLRLKASGDAADPYRDGSGELTANLGFLGERDPREDRLSASKVNRDGAAATPIGGHATFSEESCQVDMCRVGALLVVVDNNECGGAHVTFSGFYVRVGPVDRR